MGKALIIKDADFSNVAVDVINIDGKTFLTSDNYLFTIFGYTQTNGTWENSGTTQSAAWPVKAGQFVVMEPSEEFQPEWKLVSLYDSTRPAQGAVPLDSMLGAVKDNSFQVMKCTQDGYVYTPFIDESKPLQIPKLYITDDDEYIKSMLEITKENYTMFSNTYPKSDGTWGGYGNENDDTLFYPVAKGEKITVIANGTKPTYICLVIPSFTNYLTNTNGVISNNKQFPNLQQIIEGTYRLKIEAGESSSEITIPKTGYLAIWSRDVNDNFYPESVVVNI